ncbi:MDR family MFS transporter [Bacillus canaveralius]|uniref:MDR family MFS transporter n=1 Tax=Bacillus canaveralius TaxID=1403243 RepID=UPI000F798C6E|nr:MFS transporter [Bacillus canaveralius]RSK54607.1 MFS transporter [Bacillus canaveralius]
MHKDLKVILLSAFLMNIAGFAVMSFLAIHLSLNLHYSALETGTILSLLTIVSRGVPVVAGGLGDRFGYKQMMVSGLLIRGTGLLMLGTSQSFNVLIVAAVLIGLGSALYEPSAMAFFSSESNESIRRKAFSYLNICLNAGAIIGPLLGSFLLLFNPSYPFIFSGFIFYILSFFQSVKINANGITQKQQSFLKGMLDIKKNKLFLYYCFAMTFFWFMFAQLTVSIPLHMYNISHSEQMVSLVITINAITGLIFMVLFRRFYEKFNSLKLIKAGFLIMLLALAAISLNASPYWLLACILFFTIGETLVLPSSDLAVSNFTRSKFHATYFGFFEISFALGATGGNYFGAYFTNSLQDRNWPWLVLAAAGAIGFGLLSHLTKQIRSKVIMNQESVSY